LTQLDPHPHIFGQFLFYHLQEAATCFRQKKKWLGEHSLSQKINVLTEEVKKTESAPQSASREIRSLAFDKPEIASKNSKKNIYYVACQILFRQGKPLIIFWHSPHQKLQFLKLLSKRINIFLAAI